MRDTLILLTTVGLSWGLPLLGKPNVIKRSATALTDDWNDLLSIIPFDELTDVFDKHLKIDGTFVDVIEYLQGTEWHEVVDQVGSRVQVQDIIAFLEKAGFPISELLKAIDDTVLSAKPEIPADKKRSLAGFLDDVQKLLPLTKVLGLLNDKLQSSPDVQKLYVKLSSEEDHTLVDELLGIDAVQHLEQRLRESGVDIDSVIEFVYDLLGWGKPRKTAHKISRRSLSDDLDDLLNIIPFDKFKEIENEHLKTDGAFVHSIEYMKGKEWHDFVFDLPEVKTLASYLTSAGLPIEDILNAIDNTILAATPEIEADPNGSLESFFADIQKILPLTTLLGFINDKLQNSADVQKLYVRLAGENTRELVESILVKGEVQLTELGLDSRSFYCYFTSSWLSIVCPIPSWSR